MKSKISLTGVKAIRVKSPQLTSDLVFVYIMSIFLDFAPPTEAKSLRILLTIWISNLDFQIELLSTEVFPQLPNKAHLVPGPIFSHTNSMLPSPLH